MFYSRIIVKKTEKRFGGPKISGTFASFLKHKILFYYLIQKEMKKLFLSFAVIAGLSMIACTSKADNAADAEAPAEETVVEEAEGVVEEVAPVDSVAADTTVVVEEVAAAE